MIRRGRIGRPGLVGTMARTAVIAGTATAVSGGMRNAQASRAQASQQQAVSGQQEAYDQGQADAAAAAQAASVQAQLDQLQAAQAAAAPVAAAPAAGGADDLMAQIEKLAQLKNAGVLSDAEFSAAKAKLLGV